MFHHRNGARAVQAGTAGVIGVYCTGNNRFIEWILNDVCISTISSSNLVAKTGQ